MSTLVFLIIATLIVLKIHMFSHEQKMLNYEKRFHAVSRTLLVELFKLVEEKDELLESFRLEKNFTATSAASLVTSLHPDLNEAAEVYTRIFNNRRQGRMNRFEADLKLLYKSLERWTIRDELDKAFKK